MAGKECGNMSSLHRVVHWIPNAAVWIFNNATLKKRSNIYCRSWLYCTGLQDVTAAALCSSNRLWLQLPRSTFQHSMLTKSWNTAVKERNINHVRREMKNVGSLRRNVWLEFCYIMQQSAVAINQAQVHIPGNFCNSVVNYGQNNKCQ